MVRCVALACVAAVLAGSLVAAWLIDVVYSVTVKPLVDRYLKKPVRT